ncbi:hypothetical protein SAMN05443668_114123 [Cryptosporangium aurantiacum]|uniref:Uncharacterized protein n=1 Tax=Cryptosporangium aurantiacum TaxID=134849 RepID=A0A1M7RJF0_9ACTN|nr:hypothetical protein SAMN05443668_114123 [Cryptosporangium aurantiacum]
MPLLTNPISVRARRPNSRLAVSAGDRICVGVAVVRDPARQPL